jgi:hypothetical protein
LLLVATGLLTNFQANAKVLTLAQADSLKRVLKGKVTPLNQVNTLLLLSEHYLLRNGELKSDLDSASTLAEDATRMSVINNLHPEYVKSLYLRGNILLEKGFRKEGNYFSEKRMVLLNCIIYQNKKAIILKKKGI